MNIQVSKLLKEDIKAIIPVIENGVENYIEVKNPTKELNDKIAKMIEESIDNPIKQISDTEIMEILIKELTNIELNIPLGELLEMECSYEFEMVLFHISEILAQIENKMLMNAKILTTRVRNNDLKKSVSKEIEEIERINKI